MKQLLILIFSILSSCVQNKSDKIQSKSKSSTDITMGSDNIHAKNKKDSIHNYWALILDTISSKEEFKISELKHTLEVKTYSLNDSSIFRNLSQNGEQTYLDHSHKMVSDLKLLTDSIVDKMQIDRATFGNSLHPEFYSECNLLTTEIDSTNANTVYLNSSLGVPDTDNIWTVWYSIKIKNNRIGNLEINRADYVGM